LDPQAWKLSASHATETAGGATTLRGWNSGTPQTAGMWFQIELPQAVVINGVQFDSVGTVGGGRRGANPGAAGANAPAAPAGGAAAPAPAGGVAPAGAG